MGVTVTFAGSGDAFGSGGRYQSCIHVRPDEAAPVLLDCGTTVLPSLRRAGLDPARIDTVFISHLHGDHFGGLPFLLLDAQFAKRTRPLTVAGPRGIGNRLVTAMECLFPGSSQTPRRFPLNIVELLPNQPTEVGAVNVRVYELHHGSGAPALGLRITIGSTTIAYTGDTAWTDALPALAEGADLLIAEAYYRDKPVPYHLRLSDLTEHRDELDAERIVLTHLSEDMLAAEDTPPFETAHDGAVLAL